MSIRKLGLVAAIALAVGVTSAHAEKATPPTSMARPANGASEQEIKDARTQIIQAQKAKDWPAAIAIYSNWAAKYPLDFSFQKSLPLIYLRAGDQPEWEKARSDLTAKWSALKSQARPPEDNSLLIDLFRVGTNTVVVEQCLEQAGRFGVSYRYVVLADGHAAFDGFYTVESSAVDNQIARELGQPTPVVSLDHYLPGRHETVGIFHGAQDYTAMRARVSDALAHPKAPIGSSNNSGTALPNIGCQIALAR